MKDSDCWNYFGDTHKIYIPSLFIRDFDHWMKIHNYFNIPDARYNYKQSVRKKLDSMTISLKEGRDYIIKSAEREPIIKWLKSKYKEVK